MSDGLLDRLAQNPRAFTWLRKIAEANFVAVRRVVHRELDLRPGGRLLDLGCGTGELAPLFRCQDYIGLDRDRRYIDYARRRFPGMRFGVCDGAALPLADRSCDAVLIFGVLHHMSDPLARRVAAEVARVLRPGGRFLLIEDRRELSPWNLPGRLIHALDAGQDIRSLAGYASLLPRERLREVRSFTFTSGFCGYHGIHLVRPSDPVD